MRFAVILSLLLVGAECATELNDAYGTITSPGYPNPYPDNENQTWILNARPGYQIVVYFTTFDLEDSYDEGMGGDCAYDYVELQQIKSNRRFCGQAGRRWQSNGPRVYERFRSKDNQMTIHFFSDYSNEEPRPVGFEAHFYHADKDECGLLSNMVANTVEDWDELIYCDHFCVNVPGSYYCTCRHGYILHPNNHTCMANCRDVTLTADSGRIQTPGYPNKYSRLTDCEWNIAVREGLSLNLTFNSQFEIENHYNLTAECPYDYLKLSYGGNEETFCGTEAPNGGRTIMTNTRRARIRFHTDNSVEESGFELTYTTPRIRCNHNPMPPRNGTVIYNQDRGYFEFEDVVEFHCDIGFNLIGLQNIVCRSDGTWSGIPPVCQIKTCDDPAHLQIPHSALRGERHIYEYLNVVTVVCHQWYENVVGTSEWICNENSEWVGNGGVPDVVPECTPVCGVKNTGAEQSIAESTIGNGKESGPNEWPWLAFVHAGEQAYVLANTDTCGGSLISANHVLTAAHCVTTKQNNERSANRVFVWLGAHNRKKDYTGKTKARWFPVASIHRHPRYNTTNWDNDVAVLRLAATVNMDNEVRPICLPAPNTDAMDFESGVVAGWGVTERQFGSSAILKHTKLPTVDHATCWQNFLDTVWLFNKTMSADYALTDNMFCAGKTSGSQTSTCKGDSGGPFMAQTSDNKYRVYGVVSWGIALRECGESLSYSVFADIHDNMKQWVEEQLE